MNTITKEKSSLSLRDQVLPELLEEARAVAKDLLKAEKTKKPKLEARIDQISPKELAMSPGADLKSMKRLRSRDEFRSDVAKDESEVAKDEGDKEKHNFFMNWLKGKHPDGIKRPVAEPVVTVEVKPDTTVPDPTIADIASLPQPNPSQEITQDQTLKTPEPPSSADSGIEFGLLPKEPKIEEISAPSPEIKSAPPIPDPLTSVQEFNPDLAQTAPAKARLQEIIGEQGSESAPQAEVIDSTPASADGEVKVAEPVAETIAPVVNVTGEAPTTNVGEDAPLQQNFDTGNGGLGGWFSKLIPKRGASTIDFRAIGRLEKRRGEKPEQLDKAA